jgi:hypothetical protein
VIEESFPLGHDRRWIAEVSRRARQRLKKSGQWESFLESERRFAEILGKVFRLSDYDRDADPPLMIKAGNDCIPYWDIRLMQIDDIEQEIVVLTTTSGKTYTAEGFDALEAVMALKPSLLEGRRLKWRKGAWFWHNIFGHPAMQVLAWIGKPRLAIQVHDRTTPRPRQP